MRHAFFVLAFELQGSDRRRGTPRRAAARAAGRRGAAPRRAEPHPVPPSRPPSDPEPQDDVDAGLEQLEQEAEESAVTDLVIHRRSMRPMPITDARARPPLPAGRVRAILWRLSSPFQVARTTRQSQRRSMKRRARSGSAQRGACSVQRRRWRARPGAARARRGAAGRARRDAHAAARRAVHTPHRSVSSEEAASVIARPPRSATKRAAPRQQAERAVKRQRAETQEAERAVQALSRRPGRSKKKGFPALGPWPPYETAQVPDRTYTGRAASIRALRVTGPPRFSISQRLLRHASPRGCPGGSPQSPPSQQWFLERRQRIACINVVC